MSPHVFRSFICSCRRGSGEVVYYVRNRWIAVSLDLAGCQSIVQKVIMCRLLAKLLVVGAIVALAGTVKAQTPSDREVKAGFLMNFAEFVEWPEGAFASPSSSIVVGVIGEDRLGAELDKLRDRMVNGRKLEIRRFKGALEFRGEETPGRRRDDLADRRNKKLQELKSCHILFVASSEKKSVPSILKPLQSDCVLTVGDMPEFAHQGGVINFVSLENKVRLEINLDAAERARLKISSKLLNLAKVIKGKGEAE